MGENGSSFGSGVDPEHEHNSLDSTPPPSNQNYYHDQSYQQPQQQDVSE